MQILILKPESFVSYDKEIGLKLFENGDFSWFLDGEDIAIKVLSLELENLSKEQILEELEENEYLLELAIANGAVEIQDRDDRAYLNYCLSYD